MEGSSLKLVGAATAGALVSAGVIQWLTTRKDDGVSLADCPGFEGPEKRLEINCRPNADPTKNCRSLTREFWDECMKRLDGSILDHRETEHWDSYIITESSLFVSNTKVIVLTCGTTTLLQCVDFLLAGIRNHGLEVPEFLLQPAKAVQSPQSLAPRVDRWSIFSSRGKITHTLNGRSPSTRCRARTNHRDHSPSHVF